MTLKQKSFLLLFTRMYLLNTNQKIYLSLLILGTVIVLALLFYLVYKFFISKKLMRFIVSRKLYRFANLNDYLLLNEYKIKIDDKHDGIINHVLITNKYIYVIHDFPYSGVIVGSANEEQLKLVDKKGERLIANMLNYNRNLTKRLGLYNGLDNTFLKGIVVLSNDSLVDISDIPTQFAISKASGIIHQIKKMDGNEVKPFKEDTIIDFINRLNKENSVGDKE